MSEHSKGQIVQSAAEIYDEFFVPSLFVEWPQRIFAATNLAPGHAVLDVACGTGVLTNAAKEIVGASGEVTGVDINDGMLSVARSKSDAIAWDNGAAEALPYDNNQFDRVYCQFGLMFFEDPVNAITEMLRVCKPGGVVGAAVWASLEDTPGYAAVAAMLDDLFGAEIAKAMEAPFCLGNTDDVVGMFREAGAGAVKIQTIEGKARFESIGDWIYTDIRGWTLADVINDDDYKKIRNAAPDWLSQFALPDGTVEFGSPAHIVTVNC